MMEFQPARFAVLAVLLGLELGLAPPCPALPGKVEELATEGRKSLAEERYAEALALFTQARSETEDPVWLSRLLFYRAVSAQQLAQSLDRADDRRPQLLEDAAVLYGQYLEAHPESGPAHNNLATVNQDLAAWQRERGLMEAAEARDALAERHYRLAAGREDSRRAFYLQNYAEFLDRRGRRDAASAIYTRLIKEQPMLEEPHRAMVRRSLAGAGDELAGYLWEIFREGQARRATEAALEALLDGDFAAKLGPRDKHELLTVAAAGLSRETYDPETFAETEAARKLRLLASDAAVGRDAGQIVSLHLDPVFDPACCDRWTRGDLRRDPPRGLWPRDAIRALIRSLAERYRERDATGIAEQYLRLAIELEPGEVDPVAFRQLVRLKLQEGDLGAVEEMVSRDENGLFQGKTEAYRNSQVAKIFQFHKTLGELYALLGRWGDAGDVKSAIFQLEHARDKSRALEAETAAELPEEYRFTPEMTNLLATGYAETGEIDRSYQVRLEEAGRYRAAGDHRAEAAVLEPIRDREAPAELEPTTRVLMREVLDRGDTASLPAEGTGRDHVHQLEIGRLTFYPTASEIWDKLPPGDKERLYEAVEEVFTEERRRQVRPAAPGEVTLRTPEPRDGTEELLERLAAHLEATAARTRQVTAPTAKPQALRLEGEASGTLTLDVEGEILEIKVLLEHAQVREKEPPEPQ